MQVGIPAVRRFNMKFSIRFLTTTGAKILPVSDRVWEGCIWLVKVVNLVISILAES
jgi:hypothetical protein